MNLAVGLFHLLMISAVFSFEISNVINPVLSTKVDEVDDRYVMRFVDRCSDDVCQLKMSVKFRDLTSSEILTHKLCKLVHIRIQQCPGKPDSDSLFKVFVILSESEFICKSGLFRISISALT